MSDVKERIRAEVKRYAARGEDFEISDTESLLDSGLLESVAVFELVQFIEKEFGVRIEDEDIVPENFESINVLAELVARG